MYSFPNATTRTPHALRLLSILSLLLALGAVVFPTALTYAFINGQAAKLVLGHADFTTRGSNTSNNNPTPDPVTANNMDEPADVTVDPVSGKVFVADTFNNRVLRFASLSSLSNGATPEAVLGQADLTTIDPNKTLPNRMNGPNSVSVDSAGRLWVADTNNNRVLRFDNAATKLSNADADGLLGQTAYNLGASGTGSNGFNKPFGLIADTNGRLWVADTINNRVLRFDNAANKANGDNADSVVGQPDFTTTSSGTSPTTLNNPDNIALDGKQGIWISDYVNHRILHFSADALATNGAAADKVLGQPDFASHNNGTTDPTNLCPSTRTVAANTLCAPWDMVVDTTGRLWVSDSGNNRILSFNNALAKANDPNADGVLGQTAFTTAASSTTASTFNEPSGLALDSHGQILMTDYQNNRVLLFGTQIGVLGTNSQPIASGSTTPATADGTDFGTIAIAQSTTHTFTINNTGVGTLNITGTPLVAVSGAAASDFVVTQPSASSITDDTSITFAVKFTPSASGTRSATISIASDANATPYTFAVQGAGANSAPTMAPATFTIAPNVTSGTVVGTVVAADVDNNIKTTGAYAITAGNTGNTFAIDDTGKITVATASNLVGGKNFSLTVQVTDGGGLTASSTITINVVSLRQTIYLPILTR